MEYVASGTQWRNQILEPGWVSFLAMSLALIFFPLAPGAFGYLYATPSSTCIHLFEVFRCSWSTCFYVSGGSVSNCPVFLCLRNTRRKGERRVMQLICVRLQRIPAALSCTTESWHSYKTERALRCITSCLGIASGCKGEICLISEKLMIPT